MAALAVLAMYGLASLYVIFYGLHTYLLIWLFHRRRTGRREAQRERIKVYRARTPEGEWPIVTTQIPLYNEASVARRVIEAVAAMDYPHGRHEIQVLDDSTDETRDIVDGVAARLRREGVDVTVIRRPTRAGYKAGALAHALALARGEVVAVFDADFVPLADFLRRGVPLLMDRPENACLQGRWTHLNAGASWLTKAQSLAIDGHFVIEQGGRSWNGLALNFNGTAGLWRRAAIEDPAVGGWTADTLTEDLDLSYRAQMAGWTVEYCMDLPCPAEVPESIAGLKAQQYRWAKGSIQTARKLLPVVWRSRFSLGQRLEATIHLTAYSIAVWMWLLGMLALPLAWIDPYRIVGDWILALWAMMSISLTAPPVAYCYSRRVLGGGWTGVWAVPHLMVLGAGLCLSNSIAALAGLVQQGGEFVRTPKTGRLSDGPARRRYRGRASSIWLLELAASAYCAAGFWAFVRSENATAGAFLLIYAAGFAVVGLGSRPVSRRRRPAERAGSAPTLPPLAPAFGEE